MRITKTEPDSTDYPYDRGNIIEKLHKYLVILLRESEEERSDMVES